MDEKVLKSIIDGLAKGKRMALVTLTSSNGSTPRKNGSLMSVDKNGNIIGSIGGGKIEYVVIESAINCIESGQGKNFTYNLNDNGVKMACGGTIEGYIKIFEPKPNLIIFGGGHISQSICRLTDNMNFRRTVIEDREEFKEYDAFKNVEEFIIAESIEELKDINFENSYIVVVTRGHKRDTYWARELIDKNYNYIGVVGSAKKVIELKQAISENGISKELIEGMHAPIGLDISDGTPEEIAFSILSEILLVKNNGRLAHLQDVKMKKLQNQ
ncbi:XdhC family protein [Clostridium perfringens]|uniref:XdhC family protein n=1 Tax=Clostridium perfringens TaxID=1502 RepID=UPI0028E0D784|nr:XdhC/CoxI family protein [Clostridium perfringens]MDT9330420.1 XdhC/CoxI family protein [Clostridium perfringens]MDT9333214.1 XdhC/CoxI family protein [Clostridium perfringens]MDT9350055.1 XdhC/CoxI family protein [Clostridium perfringens]